MLYLHVDCDAERIAEQRRRPLQFMSSAHYQNNHEHDEEQQHYGR